MHLRKKTDDPSLAGFKLFGNGIDAAFPVQGVEWFEAPGVNRQDNIRRVCFGADCTHHLRIDERHVAGDDKRLVVTCVPEPRMNARQHPFADMDVRHLATVNIGIVFRGIGYDQHLLEQFIQNTMDMVDKARPLQWEQRLVALHTQACATGQNDPGHTMDLAWGLVPRRYARDD